MSRTFTSRPSCQTKTRGATRNAEKQRVSSTNQPGEASGRGTNITGRGPGLNRRSYQGLGQSMNRNSDTRLYGQGVNWNNTGMYGHGVNSHSNTDQYNDDPSAADPQRNQAQGGHYAGGYTMFPANARKREQTNQMAQREAEAYERHRQNNALRHVSYVGRVGGGELTEDQVRSNQAYAVRNQKLIRLKQQEEQKKAKKREEDLKIENMRAEARRKAEQNAEREAKHAPGAAEVRRNREAFLKRIEQGSSMGTSSSSSQQAPTAQRMRGVRSDSAFHN